jgi:hypothetical protein
VEFPPLGLAPLVEEDAIFRSDSCVIADQLAIGEDVQPTIYSGSKVKHWVRNFKF